LWQLGCIDVTRLVELGYWLELLVVLVVAVAHRRLGPSSSATTSTVERGAAVLRGPAALLQPADDHDLAALGQGLGCLA